MTVTVNGESRELAPDATLRDLIELCKFNPNHVAVELNRRLVRTEKYETPLKAGDEIEVVTFVGGG